MSPAPYKEDFTKGVTFLLTSIFFTEMMDVINKFLVQDYSVFQLTWLRYIFYFAMIVVYLLPRDLKTAIKTPYLRQALLLSSLSILSSIVAVQSYKYMPLADVKIIAFAAPIFVVLIGHFWLKEKVYLYHYVLVTLCFISIVFVVQPHFDQLGWVALLPIVMMMSGILKSVIMRVVKKCSTKTFMVYTPLVTIVVLAFIVPFEWQPMQISDYGLLVAAAFLCCLRDFFLIEAVKNVELSSLQPFKYSSLFWAVVAGYFFFGDVPTYHVYISLVTIVGCGYYMYHKEKQRRG